MAVKQTRNQNAKVRAGALTEATKQVAQTESAALPNWAEQIRIERAKNESLTRQIEHLQKSKVQNRKLEDRWAAIQVALSGFMPTSVFRPPSERLIGDVPAYVRTVAPQPSRSVILRAKNGALNMDDYSFSSVVPVADLNAPRPALEYDWEAYQGAIGTPFSMVPQVEQKIGLDPFSLRGLSYDQGEMERLYRGHPAVQSAIDRRIQLVQAGTWEFVVPEIDENILLQLGLTRDLLQRQADELNTEMISTSRVDWNQVRYELMWRGSIAGFAIAEFGISPFEQAGRRVRWIEPREPSSVMTWILTTRQTLAGFTQTIPSPVGGTQSAIPAVDIRKCLYFANRRAGANFEGISDCRSAWTWTRVIAEFIQSSLLNRQRFGAGVPIVNVESQSEVNASTIAAAQRSVENYVNESNATLTAPAGITFDLRQIQPDQALVPTIELCLRVIREGLDSVLFGMGAGDSAGSRALGEVKSDMLLRALAGFVSGPESAFNNFARAVVDTTYNRQDIYPVMKCRNIQTRTPLEVIEVRSGLQKLKSEGASAEMLRDAAKQSGVDPDLIAPETETKPPIILPVGSLTASLQIAQSLAGAPGMPVISVEAARELLLAAGLAPDAAERIVSAPAPVQPEQPSGGGFGMRNRGGAERPSVTLDRKPGERLAAVAKTKAKFESIDLSVSDAMRDAAKESKKANDKLPAGEKALRGIALARMNEISDGKDLLPTTWRVMNAFFTRTKTPSRGVGENENEWIIFNAWGGAAGRTRAAQVVREINEFESQADARALSANVIVRSCACEYHSGRPVVDLRAKVQTRVKSKCRDGYFVTFRALTGLEENTAFNTIRSSIDDATRIADADLKTTREVHRAVFAASARGAFGGPMPDSSAVANIVVDFTGKYADIIRAHAADLFDFAVEDMREEITAQTGKRNPVNTRQPQTSGPTREQQLEAAVRLAAQRINDRTLEELRGFGVAVANGAPVSTLTRAPMDLGFASSSAVESAMISSVAVGRDYAASEGPKVAWAIVSEAMDYMTCDPCALDDGKRCRYPSAEYERMKPPNPNCMSLVNSKGGANLCQRMIIYDFREQDEVENEIYGGDGALLRAKSSNGQTLSVICGPPTSGKSTFAKELERIVGAVIVSADDLLGLDDGQIWTSKGSREARTLAIEEIADELISGTSHVAYDGPLMTAKARAEFVASVRSFLHSDQSVTIVCFYPAEIIESELLSRNDARVPSRRIDPKMLIQRIRGFEMPTGSESCFDSVETFDKFFD